MIDERILRVVHEEEQALLRRCKPFVLGGPNTRGGGPADVIYLTPDGRWLRICPRVLIDPSFRSEVIHKQLLKYLSENEVPDSIDSLEPAWEFDGQEVVLRISPWEAAWVFLEYGWSFPTELREHMAGDAVRAELEPVQRAYLELFPTMDHQEVARLVNLEAMKQGSLSPDELSERDALTARRAEERPASRSTPPPTFPEFLREQIERRRKRIPRNALLSRLREWSANWPDEYQELDVSLTEKDWFILLTLFRDKRRYTVEALPAAAKKHDFEIADSTVRQNASRLKKLGLLDNSQKTEPKGYGLTDLGRRVAAQYRPQ